MADDFGRSQLRLRFATLLARLVTEWEAQLVVVDGSPFHLGLGRAVGDVFGMEEGDLPRALADDVRETLTRTRWACLDVLGPEPWEVATFDAVAMQPGAPRKLRKNRARGWILNRDAHRTHFGGDPRLDCTLIELAAARASVDRVAGLTDHRFLHIMMNIDLAMGTPAYLRAPSRPTSEQAIVMEAVGAADWSKAWRRTTELLGELESVRWDPASGKLGAYERVAWQDWLEGLFR